VTGRGEVARLKQRLDNVFNRAPPSSAPLENQADFAKYLCVLVSGYLEKAVVALLEDLAIKRSAPEIASYVEHELSFWMNPSTGKICDLLRAFSSAWGQAAEAYFVDEKKAHINTLVSLRHRIAHGEDVPTTLSQIKEYYRTTVTVVGFIADLVDPI
jgi:hypothetical protein